MGKLTISMAIPRKHPMNMGQNEETHGSNQEEIRSGSRVGPLAFSGVAGLGSHGKLQKDVELYEMSRKMMASSSFEWKNPMGLSFCKWQVFQYPCQSTGG